MERYLAAHPEDVWSQNDLAWLAWRSGQREVAKRQFEILDGDFDDDAWDDDITAEQVQAWAESANP